MPERTTEAQCPDKSRLMDQYSSAITEFGRVAAVLNARMGTIFKGDYERLSMAMNATREASEQCHRALRAHIAEHGC